MIIFQIFFETSQVNLTGNVMVEKLQRKREEERDLFQIMVFLHVYYHPYILFSAATNLTELRERIDFSFCFIVQD